MDISNRYKQKRRKTLARRLFFVCVFVLFLFLLLLGSFWISFFRIKTITTTGMVAPEITNNLVAEHIKGINSFFLPRSNFFILNTDDVAQFIKEKNFGIASVEKKFPNMLSIIFPEREAHFIVCNSNNVCFYINESGLLYSEAPQFSEYPLPLIVIDQSTSSSQNVAWAISLGDQLAGTSTMRFLNIVTQGLSALGVESKTIQIYQRARKGTSLDFTEMKIFTPEEWYIYLNTQIPPETLLDNIKLLFEQKIKENKTKLQYIDMRFENKAFYMLY